MKTLKPILHNRYRCEFCNHKIYFSKSACEEHENKCYRNPNRNCITCDNTGTEYYVTFDLRMKPTEKGKDCSSCMIAQKIGGKSYIINHLKGEHNV